MPPPAAAPPPTAPVSDAPVPESAPGPAPKPATDRRVPWRGIGLAVIGLALASPLLAWLLGGALTDRDATTETMILLGTGSAAALAAAVWVVAFSGWSRVGKAAAVGGGVAAVALLFGLFRVQVDGAMKITGFQYRFGETPEDRALAFAAENRAAARPAAPAADAERPAAADAGGTTEPPPPLAAGPGDWPGLLGPNRDGVVPNAAVSADWSADPPRVVWKHPVGPGWGGFAVVGDRCFTLEQRGDRETVVCYRADDGAELWATGTSARFARLAANGGDGPASTPLFHESTVLSFGATGVASCCDARTGELLWERDLLPGDENIQWGLACSPLVAGGSVVLLPGAAAGQNSAAVGLDPRTGETKWSSGDSPASYSSPVVADIASARQMLAFEADGLRGMRLSGETLWDIPWTNGPFVNAAVPIVSGDDVFLSSGYGTGAAVYSIESREAPTGTDAAAETFETREVWTTPNRFKLKFNDAILHDGFLYGLDEGILSCVEFATGERRWKAGRYGYGQCLLLGGENGRPVLLVSCEDGDLVLVDPSPQKHAELARYSAANDGQTLLTGTCWNHPAFVRGRLFWRNGAEAVCLDLPGDAPAEVAAE